MRTPRAVNSLIDDLFERKYRKVGIERLVRKKNALGFFSRRVFCFNIVRPGKGSKYREFYALSGRMLLDQGHLFVMFWYIFHNYL